MTRPASRRPAAAPRARARLAAGAALALLLALPAVPARALAPPARAHAPDSLDVPAAARPGAPAEAAGAGGAVGPATPAADGARRDPGPFFYRALPYGSESLVSPLRLVVNSSYGILQLDNRDRRLTHVHYANGLENVWTNLRDPFTSIRASGWRDFVMQEVLPFSTSTRDARYWPNYTQHLVGGGMTYRLMREWYEAHGWRHATGMAVGTMAVTHFFNEIVENDDYVGRTTDPIADLYLFDPLGIVLFSHDGVAGFFGRTLHMADWSYQPCFEAHTGSLRNNGQNFAIKYRLGGSRWSLFDYFGVHSEAGLSFAPDAHNSFSFGAGLKSSDLIDLGRGTRTVDLVPSAGLFWDRDNSLMLSVLYARERETMWRINVYPGVMRVGLVSPGVFLGIGHGGGLSGGLTAGSSLPLPVGFAVQR